MVQKSPLRRWRNWRVRSLTPFTFAEDIAPSAKKLSAFGIDAKDVTGELRKLGDISAGLGVPLNQLSEMFGKAKVSGRLFGEDINCAGAVPGCL
ncbi:MAG: hypothetical protein R3C18_17520 [Planctomycetaceae bacterium]